jgi:hypothetical protein
MNAVAEQVPISLEEAVHLGARDGVFYSHYFFPKTVRQGSPKFHGVIWDLFTRNRNAHARVFRGGAKTSIARLFTSRRVAYGISHTILYIGKSQDHAARSVEWIMRNVEFNSDWSQVFGLRKGNKWTATECEIISEAFESRSRIIALGITGSVRGVNVDDYRPDLIIVDDPLDEENAATPESRMKINELFFGAIKESLVPASEDPSAGLFLLQTPFENGDLSDVCLKSPDFECVTVGILDEAGNSAWPERWTSNEILEDKASAIQRNQLSLWMREKMCTIVGREENTFKQDWLRYWTVLPAGARYYMAIDPAPIQSDISRAKGIKTDLQAVMVCAYHQGNKYLVEYATARDEDPEALAGNVDRLSRKYPVMRCGVESIAYQRTLKWFLEKQMRDGKIKHLRIEELNVGGTQSKHNRIVQAHLGRASSGSLYVKPEHQEFIDQFVNYPKVQFKDLLDVSAMCDATAGTETGMTYNEEGEIVGEEDYKDLGEWRGAP